VHAGLLQLSVRALPTSADTSLLQRRSDNVRTQLNSLVVLLLSHTLSYCDACACRYVGVFSAVYAGSRAAAPRADELMEHTTADDIEATLLKVQHYCSTTCSISITAAIIQHYLACLCSLNGASVLATHFAMMFALARQQLVRYA
jgi:hypothetical protein